MSGRNHKVKVHRFRQWWWECLTCADEGGPYEFEDECDDAVSRHERGEE